MSNAGARQFAILSPVQNLPEVSVSHDHVLDDAACAGALGSTSYCADWRVNRRALRDSRGEYLGARTTVQVPEPASLLLVGAGMLSIAALIRSQRR
jgi:hypothetical protein